MLIVGVLLPSMNGLDLSTVTAFFNLVPFRISPNNASTAIGGADGGPLPNEGAGGGGGGGGGADMVWRLQTI